MPVTVQWDTDAPITGEPDSGSAQKVYTESGAGTVTVTDEAVGGPSITLNYTLPLGLTTVEPVPTEVDSAGDQAARTTTVAGENFPPSASGTVAIATGAPGAYGTTVVSSPATTNAAGVFTGIDLTVPQGQAAGDYHIEVTFGDIGDLQAALTVVNNALVAPTNVTSPSQTTNTVNISWDPVTGADEYLLQWKPSTSETWTEIDPATSPHTVSGLQADTSYDFQVMARNSTSGATSPWGPEPPLTQPTPAQDTLPAPTSFAADSTSITATEVPFTWDTVTDAQSYTIQWRTGTEWTPVPDIAASPYTVTGLTANTDYEFQIKAVADGFLDSAWAPATPLAVTTALEAPTATAGTVGTDSLQITWGTVGGAESYTARIAENGTTVWTEEPVASGTSHTFTGLTNGQPYDMQVRADSNTAPSSAWSNVITGTPA